MSLKPSLVILAASFLTGMSNCAQAGKNKLANFRIDNIGFQVPIPKGFCAPTGDYLIDAHQIAQADIDNETHLILYACQNDVIEPNGASIAVKTPKSMLHVDMNQKEFDAFMGAGWDVAFSNNRMEIDQAMSRAKAKSMEALSININFKNEIRPLGQDATCRYAAGAFDASNENLAQTIYVGLCLSLVAGRAMNFYRYERKMSKHGFVEILSNVKTLRSSVNAKKVGK